MQTKAERLNAIPAETLCTGKRPTLDILSQGEPMPFFMTSESSVFNVPDAISSSGETTLPTRSECLMTMEDLWWMNYLR